MMVTGLVLREVPLLCGHKRRVGRLVPLLCGDKSGAGAKKCGSESVTPTRIFLLSETQVQAFETKPAPR
jgi:hypothetical protein